MKVSLKAVYENVRQILQARGVENAKNEAYFLLNNHIPTTRGELLLGTEREVEEQRIDTVMLDVMRRVEGEPLQYILGKWEFYGLPFLTLPGVLIPRSETEMIVDEILAKTTPEQAFSLLDVCSGSGCIGLAVAKHRPLANVTLFDISATAIDAGRRNSELLEVQDRVQLVQGDILNGPAIYFPGKKFDFLSSNPPYIKSIDLSALSREVQKEPMEALDGGVDGLTYYRVLAEKWHSVLQSGGHAVLEAGADTTAAAAALFTDPWKETVVHRDLEGRERMITTGI